MFYSASILSSKAALGQVWIAGTFTNQKIPKRTVQELNVAAKCKDIMFPVVELSLRISSHLMYGVARVHDAQVQQFANDCNAVLVKVRLAYKPAEQQKTTRQLELEIQPLLDMPAALEEIAVPEPFELMPGAAEAEVILPPMGLGMDYEMAIAPPAMMMAPAEELAPFPEAEYGVSELPPPPGEGYLGIPEIPLPEIEVPIPELVPPEEFVYAPAEVPPAHALAEMEAETARRKRRAKVAQYDVSTMISSEAMKAQLRDVGDITIDRPLKALRLQANVASAYRGPSLSLPGPLRSLWTRVTWVPDMSAEEALPLESADLLPEVEKLRAELSASLREPSLHLPSPGAMRDLEVPRISKPPSPIPMPMEAIPEAYEMAMPPLPELDMDMAVPAVPEAEYVRPLQEREPMPASPEEAERVAKYHSFLFENLLDESGTKVSDTVSFFAVTADTNRLIAARAFYLTLALQNQGKLRVKQDAPYGDITIHDISAP